MNKTHCVLEADKLLGFEDIQGEFDVSEAALSGRVGAKVGEGPEPDRMPAQILDLRDPALDSRVGAKISPPEPI